MTEFIQKDLSKKVIGAFYTVYNTLGYGFLEKVYENALCIELKSQGIYVESQVLIEVF
ncbi:MAG: GxxExxY protein [Bacteroidales bacterium]